MATSSTPGGVTMRLDGRELTIAPLTLGQLKRLAPQFQLLGTIGGALRDEQIDALIAIVHAALARHHPEIAPAEVAELVDLGNAGPLLRAILGASGLVSAGEARAGSVSTPSTGMS
ncbi:MAG TPA: hypothetical protein VKY65_17945 [Alphaproteobacteria bacterium]|nr:hypothetical protein [Alphaproteobacteria bacterium]